MKKNKKINVQKKYFFLAEQPFTVPQYGDSGFVNSSLSKRAYNGCKLHCKFIKSLEAFKWKEAEKMKDKSIGSQHTLQQVTLSRTLGFSTAHGAKLSKHHLLQSNLQTLRHKLHKTA